MIHKKNKMQRPSQLLSLSNTLFLRRGFPALPALFRRTDGPRTFGANAFEKTPAFCGLETWLDGTDRLCGSVFAIDFVEGADGGLTTFVVFVVFVVFLVFE